MATATAARRNRKGRARRDEILAHAVRLIDERGYAGLRPSDVMAAAGASPALFYWYFRDMDDLVAQLAVDARRAIRHAMAEAASGADDPLDRLYLATRECLRMAFENETLRVLAAADAEGTIGGSFAAEIRKAAEATVADTVMLLSEGQARGVVTRDSTALQLAYCVRGTVQDSIVAFHRGTMLGTPDELADAAAGFIRRAVAGAAVASGGSVVSEG